MLDTLTLSESRANPKHDPAGLQTKLQSYGLAGFGSDLVTAGASVIFTAFKQLFFMNRCTPLLRVLLFSGSWFLTAVSVLPAAHSVSPVSGTPGNDGTLVTEHSQHDRPEASLSPSQSADTLFLETFSVGI